MKQWLINTWYKPHPIRWLLSPLSLIYRMIASLRKRCYTLGLFKQSKLPCPVIIVGNITVGGTGKTPFIIWLAQQLSHAGFKPGIVSRGYGGYSEHYPLAVTLESEAAVVGDEPLMIAQRTKCPVVVSPKRYQAGIALLENYDCDVILSDDGLQHYALARDVEIVIVDGQRQFGNHYCLPAGPLREPLSRLKNVDFIVENTSGEALDNHYPMTLIPAMLKNLNNETVQRTIDTFQHQSSHAVAGIGNPSRFFSQLRNDGLTITEHPFTDHHEFHPHDLMFGDDKPIIMTEKDAVKCQSFATDNMWYLPVKAQLPNTLFEQIINTLSRTL
jgi:tetraacyldisaccharide 4'-kinase